MRPLWSRLRQLLTRRGRYKATRIGVLFSSATLIVFAAAVVSGNNLLFLIAAAMAATLLVSSLVSRLCLAALELDFLVPEHVAARRTVPARLYVRNQKWLIPSFSIHVEAIPDPASPTLASAVYFPLIAARAIVEETVDVRFPKRGPYRQNSFGFSTSFPFGFLEKFARVTLLRETVVYPSIDPKPGFEELLAGIAGEIETHYRGLGSDFYRIRPYEPFESARHVDWKASAHAGALQVREFAREQEQVVEVFFDRNAPPELDAWFEHAVDCCAFLVWRLSNQGAAIHFRSNGIALRQPEDGDIYTILKFLALVYPQAAAPEAPFSAGAYQVVFTSTPEKFAESGWAGARILSPGSIASGCATGKWKGY